jgi:flagellar M-ring protein FliF
MAGFSDATQQAKQFWTSRTTGQKGLLLAGGAVTILLLAFFSRMIGSPDYKPLYTGLESADAQTLTAQLDAQGVPHQASADGKTISVPADKLDAARLQTATQGAPHSGRMGFELFDKVSWGQTEFDEKVTYQRALEGELERTIETLSDVASARVHIVMPTDSAFADSQRAAKASVILKLRHDTLSKDAVLAISRLVSGAVDELKPEDVSIVDAGAAPGSDAGASGGRGQDPGQREHRLRSGFDRRDTAEVRSGGERAAERAEDAATGRRRDGPRRRGQRSRRSSGNQQQRAFEPTEDGCTADSDPEFDVRQLRVWGEQGGDPYGGAGGQDSASDRCHCGR